MWRLGADPTLLGRWDNGELVKGPQLRKRANLPEIPEWVSHSPLNGWVQCFWHKILSHIFTVYLELILDLSI